MPSTVMSDLPTTTQAGERWLRISAVMHATSLSRSTIYSLMESGKLKSIKVGGARRIAASALAEFMASFGDGDSLRNRDRERADHIAELIETSGGKLMRGDDARLQRQEIVDHA